MCELPNGDTVTDGRSLTAGQIADLEKQASSDFAMNSSEQGNIDKTVMLHVDAETGGISLKISADIHYSGPTVTVVRTGSGVWPTTDTPSAGRSLSVGYRNGSVSKGTLLVELRTQAGKLVAKNSGKAYSLGSAWVSVPKKTKAGQYVLRVYVVGAKAKGKKAKSTTIQNLPVQIAPAG